MKKARDPTTWLIGVVMGLALGGGLVWTYWDVRYLELVDVNVGKKEELEQYEASLVKTIEAYFDASADQRAEIERLNDQLNDQMPVYLEAIAPKMSPEFCDQWAFNEYETLVTANSDLASLALFHAGATRNLVNLCLEHDYERWWPHATEHLNETIQVMSMLHSWLVQEEGG